MGDVKFHYSWDRRSEDIEIAGSHFARTAGNAFLARYDGHGSWFVRQLSSISDSADDSLALREIQQKLLDDPFVASLSIAF